MRTNNELLRDTIKSIEENMKGINESWENILREASEDFDPSKPHTLSIEDIMYGEIYPSNFVDVREDYDEDGYEDDDLVTFRSDGSDIVGNFFYDENGEFFAGVEKLVYVPYYEDRVVKLVIRDNGANREDEVYNDAVRRGVDEFFTKIYETGIVSIDGTPYDYTIAEKREDSSDDGYYRFRKSHWDSSKTPEYEDKRYILSGFYGLEMFMDYFDFCVPIEKIQTLIAFLNDWGIGDLHSENVRWGYDNTVKIIDYSDIC